MSETDPKNVDEAVGEEKPVDGAVEEPKTETKEEATEEAVKQEENEPKVEEKMEEPKEESKEEPKAEPKEEPKEEVKEEVKEETKDETKEEKKDEPKEKAKEEVKEEPKDEAKEENKDETKEEEDKKDEAEAAEDKEEVKEVEEKKQVVVIGAGLGGAPFVSKLVSSKSKCNITVIERREVSFAKYGGVRSATLGNNFAYRVTVPNSKLVPPKFGKVVHANATSIDVENQVVKLDGEVPEVRYDYLVLATGSKSNSPAEWPDNITTFKDVMAYYEDIRVKLSNSKNILVIGAGPLGCEMVGEIKDAFPDKSLSLLDLADSVLGTTKPPVPESMRKKLAKKIEKRGIKLYLDQELKDFSFSEFSENNMVEFEGGKKFKTSKDEEIDVDLIIKCTGTTTRTQIYPKEWKDENDLIRVNPYFQIVKEDESIIENVFALGDINNFPEAKLGYLAGVQAGVLAGNVNKLVKGKTKLKAYNSKKSTNMVVPLGKNSGQGYFFIPLGGFLTGLIKGRGLFLDTVWPLYKQKGKLIKAGDKNWEEKTKEW